jgi:hypothetical protein
MMCPALHQAVLTVALEMEPEPSVYIRTIFRRVSKSKKQRVTSL